jgi:hypothetical protein
MVAASPWTVACIGPQRRDPSCAAMTAIITLPQPPVAALLLRIASARETGEIHGGHRSCLVQQQVPSSLGHDQRQWRWGHMPSPRALVCEAR